jgi:hypothetical protein
MKDFMKAKPVRTTVQRSWQCVSALTPFETSNGNLFGHWRILDTGIRAFVVYSYGEHWPLYIYFASEKDPGWAGNMLKRSVTTSKHLSCAAPRGDAPHSDTIQWADTNALREQLYGSVKA